MDESVLMRTLFLAGYTVTDVNRGANQLEILCERRDILGALVKYAIALTDSTEPSEVEMDAFRDEAAAEGRIVVGIAPKKATNWLSWEEVLEALGGAVPSWRALDDSYAGILNAASKNEKVAGSDEQGWSIFEQAVADGLEFVLGLKVRRHGGLRRGTKVSDMFAETADGRVLVVDAKASAGQFDVSAETVRQLTDYVMQAMTHQKGANPVGAAVVAARAFAQTEERLLSIANEFLSETQIPLSFMTTGVLLHLITYFKQSPEHRRAIPWRRIFCQCGLVKSAHFDAVANTVQVQRIPR